MPNLDYPYDEQAYARMMERVSRGSTEACWLWNGSTDPDGYGQLSYRTADNGSRYLRAHRFAARMRLPDWDASLHVLHSCDVRNCVNPAHLRMGTDHENWQECRAKGRAPGRAMKLTAEEAVAIATSAEKARVLACRYGISPDMVKDIRRGRAWRWVTGIKRR